MDFNLADGPVNMHNIKKYIDSSAQVDYKI